jgi:hypothetical protein
MKKYNSKKTILVVGTVIFIILSFLFVSWGKSNQEEYNRKIEQYWIDYAKYCEAKDEKLVKHSHEKKGNKGYIVVTYEGSCEKK